VLSWAWPSHSCTRLSSLNTRGSCRECALGGRPGRLRAGRHHARRQSDICASHRRYAAVCQSAGQGRVPRRGPFGRRPCKRYELSQSALLECARPRRLYQHLFRVVPAADVVTSPGAVLVAAAALGPENVGKSVDSRTGSGCGSSRRRPSVPMRPRWRTSSARPNRSGQIRTSEAVSANSGNWIGAGQAGAVSLRLGLISRKCNTYELHTPAEPVARG
jgi:hypothetical protein